MNKIRERAQLQFPAVLLTLISIIQALALELMWSKISESDFLFAGGVQAWVGWGMFSVAFLGLLQIWVMYTTMVMGFIWQPSLRDSIFPFLIGIQQFILIDLIGEEFRGVWLHMLASVFVTCNWIVYISMRRARQHGGNAHYFDTVSPATLKDMLPLTAIVVLFVGLGIVVDFLSGANWIPLIAIVIANLILVTQIIGSRRLWRHLMAETHDTELEESSSE